MPYCVGKCHSVLDLFALPFWTDVGVSGEDIRPRERTVKVPIISRLDPSPIWR